MRGAGRRRLMSASVMIFFLALVAGLWQMFFPVGFGFGAGWEGVAIARELARSGAYANPFQAGPSGVTAVIAPLFPIYLAFLIKLLGDTPSFALAASLVAVLAQAFHAALLPRLSKRFFATSMPGVFAGILSALAFALMPQWDAAFTACGTVLFLLYSNASTLGASFFSGGAAGLLLLLNPSTVLISAPWMLFLCGLRRTSMARMIGFAVALFLVALPWMIRNQIVLGVFAVKDNFGMTVYASNNDCADSSISASKASGCYEAMHPNTSPPELNALNWLGEARYDRIRTAQTVRWVRSNPRTFVRLTARRIREFWFPRALAPRHITYTIWLLTAASLPGLLMMALGRVPVTGCLLAIATVYPLIYYVVVSDVRYRYPVLWLSLLSAGYFMSAAYRRLLLPKLW